MGNQLAFSVFLEKKKRKTLSVPKSVIESEAPHPWLWDTGSLCAVAAAAHCLDDLMSEKNVHLVKFLEIIFLKHAVLWRVLSSFQCFWIVCF